MYSNRIKGALLSPSGNSVITLDYLLRFSGRGLTISPGNFKFKPIGASIIFKLLIICSSTDITRTS